MTFSAGQSLNKWVLMLDAIYGGSQNYAKTTYEIHAHLTEVCGIFAKHYFKKRDVKQAKEFIPKIFAWSVALMRKMHPNRNDLEDIILRKFPHGCSYCLEKPCACWKGEKPTLQENELRDRYYQIATTERRSINDFQLMFRQIYSESWSGGNASIPPDEIQRRIFVRLIEEVAEVGESIRFHHLYPENFENELADIMAWWFAMVSTFPNADGDNPILAEDVLWGAYPGHCPECQMVPCLCRPGPVRQLMSRPLPGHAHRFDSLTSTLNQGAYNEDISKIESGEMSIPLPTVCVRLDVDDFKKVNDTHGHAAGDEALRHIASVIRRTVRERDRVYRISGDEFGVLCPNFSEEEGFGVMRRICKALVDQPVRWVAQDSKPAEFYVSVSIGVAELSSSKAAKGAFELADKAAYASKKAGKGTVTKASTIAEEK